MLRVFSSVVCTCALLLLSLCRLAAMDGTWHTFHLQDVNGPVRAVTRGPDGALYVGGSFTEAGGIAVHNIARWHNGVWSALGSGLTGGTEPSVDALLVAPDGSLYAGGQFTTAGGRTATNIAQWDGNQWHPLIGGTNNRVRTLAFGDGALYIGGNFTVVGGQGASGVARWKNSQWSALGTGIKGGFQIVTALLYKDGLYVGGNFTEAGGTQTDNIAFWDGAQWSAPGKGIGSFASTVHDLLFDPSGRLIAAGNFPFPGLTTTANVRVLDGDTWQPLGYFNGPVYMLAIDNGRLLAAGGFTAVGATKYSTTTAKHLAVLDSTWQRFGAGTDGAVYALLAGDGGLITGGDFSLSGNSIVNNIALWQNSTASRLGPEPGTGINGIIHTLAVAPNGDLYAGGDFTVAGTTAAGSIARWDGAQWHALGTGVNGSVHAIAIDRNGIVYAGGVFTEAGSTSANAIARWNGTAWESLNTNTSYSRVYSLAVSDAGTLYAGGLFSRIGSTNANNVARWNNGVWTHMNSGVNGTVYAMAYRNGKLFIGGEFTATAAGDRNGIAEWDGVQWQAVRNGVDGTVFALAFDRAGRLYAGGNFLNASEGIQHIAMWDGLRWDPLKGGTNHDVTALATDSSGTVFAAGFFTLVGGVSATKIAAWSGSTWQALDEVGIGGTPAALAAARNRMYVGGAFYWAGGLPSHNLAAWLPCSLAPVISPGPALTICRDSSVVLTVPGTYRSYRWSNGATTASITVSQPGAYSVTVDTDAGCSATSEPVHVAVADVLLHVSGTVTTCAGGSVQLLATGAVSYTWSPSAGLSCTECAAPVATPDTNIIYTVHAVSAEGCQTTATVSVLVQAAPAKPTIVFTGGFLSCPDAASTYQWLLDDFPIPGATESVWVPVEPGSYSIRITNSNACSATSDPVEVALTSVSARKSDTIAAPALTGAERLYTLELTSAHATPLSVHITDVLGRTALAIQCDAAQYHRVPLDLRHCAGGLYVVQIQTNSGWWSRTLLLR